MKAASPPAWYDRSDRLRLEITGPDQIKLLQNLTTNDVSRLRPGQGCEAFVTSHQGRTLGWVTLLRDETSLLVRSDPGAMERLKPHFEKYAIFDDVAWEDLSSATWELHLFGSGADELVADLGLPVPGTAELDHARTAAAGGSVRVLREAPTGRPGLTLIGPRTAIEEVPSALRKRASALDAAAFDLLRIAAGTPVYGRDITPANLPQEIARDRRAISFTKGCYLGQETVARLDALGHVNQRLTGLRLDLPATTGTVLSFEGKPVGAVTSAAPVPSGVGAVAMGFIRVAHAHAGTVLTFDHQGRTGRAVVTDFPIPLEAPAPA